MNFSIVIPVYNVAPYLRECLDSVRAQTFADWECICVDDGSTDGSGDILDEYASKDSRFRVIHQKNAGVSAARNKGLDEAQGEWVVFLDGDDVLAPTSLECIARLGVVNVDLIRFGYRSFKTVEPPPFTNNDANGFHDIDISHSIDMSDFFVLLWQHAFRRTILDGLRFKSFRRGEDRVFIDDVLLHRVNSIRVPDAVLHGYRLREGSAMNSQPSTQVLLDEMDHRLDIIRMIDDSPKTVVYADNRWLEGYFTREFPLIAGRRKADRRALVAAWRERMRSLRSAKGFSRRGAFLVRLASRRATFPLAWLLCYWVPRIRLSIRYKMGIIHRRLLGKQKSIS